MCVCACVYSEHACVLVVAGSPGLPFASSVVVLAVAMEALAIVSVAIVLVVLVTLDALAVVLKALAVVLVAPAIVLMVHVWRWYLLFGYNSRGYWPTQMCMPELRSLPLTQSQHKRNKGANIPACF